MFNKIKKLFSKKSSKNENENEKDHSLTVDDPELRNTEQATIAESQKKTVLIFDQKRRLFITKTKYSALALFCPYKKEFHIRKLDGTLQKVKFNPLEDEEFAYPVAGDWIGNDYDGIGIYYPKTGLALLKNSIDDNNQADITIDTKLEGDYIPLAGNWQDDGIDTLCFYNKEESIFIFPKKDAKSSVLHFGKKGNNYIPISGDWDNAGYDRIGLFDQDSSSFLLKLKHKGGVADIRFQYGSKKKAWLPIVGLWNGDEAVGLFNLENNTFHLRNDCAGGLPDLIVKFKPDSSQLIPLSIGLLK